MVKERRLIGEEKGMRMATFTAMFEQEGDHRAAYNLWIDSMAYPCNEINSMWRLCRADYCEYHIKKSLDTGNGGAGSSE
ncbi:ANR family transcriptional regulator [Enterobacter mori]|uniref:ANR family transcriptional regulator n=1 Tax=Enterobacter mori TaxID=539813 RepID=UPI003AFFF05E